MELTKILIFATCTTLWNRAEGGAKSINLKEKRLPVVYYLELFRKNKQNKKLYYTKQQKYSRLHTPLI